MKPGDTASVYILTNRHHTVLYIGVTTNLRERIAEHRNRVNPSAFTAKYNCTKLVYVEHCSDINDAIRREKQLKGWVRAKKVRLIDSMNPNWDDLADPGRGQL
jgi:putative endonuclease